MKKLGRNTLLTVSTVALIISLAMTVGGVLMIVFGAHFDSVLSLVLMIVFGAIMAILGFLFLIVSLVMLCTSFSMIKTFGSTRDDNIALRGTENSNLCPNCGCVMDGEFCSNCGSTKNEKPCECGYHNKPDAKFCSHCGKKL